MDEERTSRPHAHPMQAATTTWTIPTTPTTPTSRAGRIPEQRTRTAPQHAKAGVPSVPPVMSVARIILAVIFAMLLAGVVTSFIYSRA